MSVSKDLIRSCLYNWLGYGNSNGPIWFVGIRREVRRSGGGGPKPFAPVFKSVRVLRWPMDFRGVWKDEYGIPLKNFIKQRGSLTPWHFEASPLLAFHDQPVIQNHFPCRSLDEWENEGRRYSVVGMDLNGKWKILYLSMPFFGQGLKQATKA